MSTLWTPGGEHPVERGSRKAQPEPPPSGPAEPTPGGPDRPGTGARGPGDSGPGSEEELAARLAELRDQLASTPAAVVVANHAFGLFELAALHLSLQPPQLGEAQLAIDALGALVEGLAGRLGDHEPELQDALAQLRMAFVQIKAASGSPGAGEEGDGQRANGQG